MDDKHIEEFHYFSALEGFEEQESGEELVYFGKVFRIPRAVIEECMATGDEEKIRKTIESYEEPPESMLQDMGELQPIEDGLAERYEIYDIETGDLLVMWRIPYRLNATAEEG